MKIFITGGTGFIGRSLVVKLIEHGHPVTLLTRSVPRENRIPSVSYIGGDPTEKGAWQAELAAHEVVINLAGASIFCRWNAETKMAIRNSRVLSTKNIVEALPNRKKNGITLLNGSAVGYYGSRGDEILDESSSAGDDFLSSVVQEWEAAAKEAEKRGVRVVLCRFGVVLEKSGGALGKMLSAFKWGLGSPLGSGKQWFSWIHMHDLVNIFMFLMEHREISGPVNCTAPNPVTNREMSQILGRTLHRPVFLPAVPAFLVKQLLGEFGSILLEGQKVIPAKLLSEKFTFRYPAISDAFAESVGGK